MRVFTRWNEKFSTEETNELITELALCHCARINSLPVREYLTACVTSGRILDLCNFNVAYGELTVNDACEARQVCAFFSKRADLEFAGIDRLDASLRTFKEAEELCRQTNVIFENWTAGNFRFPRGVEEKFFLAQRKISSILGDVPSLSELKLRFGPGATTQVAKKNASARRKLGKRFACSEEFLPGLREKLEELQGWIPFGDSDSVQVPVEVHPGKLAFVPKNYKTLRGVVVEPMLNSMFQLGIGDNISRKLSRFGVDLKDQSRNQRLALEGSLTGALATLDLSSASDTIAIELVAHLLPVDWFLFLSQFRTGTVEYEGYRLKLEKFSSMGNGFTFPLESLIFYALALSCTRVEDHGVVSVYGDDIIVPVYAYDGLCELLRCAGFIPNTTKSFSTGPFRESCGADYMNGINIRPSYIKDVLAGFDAFRLHNQYVRRNDQESAAIILRWISEPLRRFGPDGYGDGHLIGAHPLRPHGRNRGWSGHTFETYAFRPLTDFSVSPGDRVYPVYCTYISEAVRPPPPKGKSVASLREFALSFTAGSDAHRHTSDGQLGVSIPGRDKYRLVKIYTLG